MPPTLGSECRISDWELVTQQIALSPAAEPAAQVEMTALDGSLGEDKGVLEFGCH